MYEGFSRPLFGWMKEYFEEYLVLYLSNGWKISHRTFLKRRRKTKIHKTSFGGMRESLARKEGGWRAWNLSDQRKGSRLNEIGFRKIIHLNKDLIFLVEKKILFNKQCLYKICLKSFAHLLSLKNFSSSSPTCSLACKGLECINEGAGLESPLEQD